MSLGSTEKHDCYRFTIAASISLRFEYNRDYTEDGEGHSVRDKNTVPY